MSNAQDFATIYESIKDAARAYFGGLDAAAEQRDLIQEAACLVLEAQADGKTLEPAQAIKDARAKLRRPRLSVGGKQVEVGMAYFSAKIGSEDGLTIGETIADERASWVSGLSAAQRAEAQRLIAEGSLTDRVAAARINEAASAHGAANAARGAANAKRGALNDALILELVERCGGRGSYGLAGKIVAILADEYGITIQKLDVNNRISRAFKRTDGRNPHSARD